MDFAGAGRLFVTNGTSLCASPSRESTYRAMESAKAAGSRVVLDVDYRSMSWERPEDAGLAIRLALPLVDVLWAHSPSISVSRDVLRNFNSRAPPRL